MDDELVAFVNVRNDEDEATAKAAARCPLVHQNGHEDGDWSWLRDYGQPQPVQMALIDHQSRFDPARVLRAAEAKRRVVRSYVAAAAAPSFILVIDGYPAPRVEAARKAVLDALHAAVLDLATEWSDHPAYQQRWAL